MARLLQQGTISGDMAAGSVETPVASIDGIQKVSVVIRPDHVDTTGWTAILWIIPIDGGEGLSGRPFPNSLDIQIQVVSGSGLPARQKASTQMLEFKDLAGEGCYLQIYDTTGTTVSIDYVMTGI